MKKPTAAPSKKIAELATADSKKLLAAAKAGKLDKILDLAGFDLGDDPDDDSSDSDEPSLVALKWLLVAADFGHDTEDDLDALMTGSNLHYDDGQMAEASVELELGENYLRGEDGLKVDLVLARAHLERAHELKIHVTTDVGKGFPAIRKQLTPAALAVFDTVFGDKPKVPKKPKPKKR